MGKTNLKNNSKGAIKDVNPSDVVEVGKAIISAAKAIGRIVKDIKK